jgi:DNA repair exonuclease SbcCD nuclease subunit
LHEKAKKLVNRAFQNLVDLAISERVDFVLLAGDIYDTADREPSAELRFYRGLRKLSDAGIKVFMAHGNHDPLSAEYLNGSKMPENVHVFPSGEVEIHIFEASNKPKVTIAGISYSSKSEPDNLVPKFKNAVGSTVIGVLHTNVGGNSQHGNYAPCSAADLEQSNVNYWALGHIHDRQVHKTNNGYWAYPGNLQGRSTKPTECGPKGALIVEVEENGAILEPKFIACDSLRFLSLEIDLSGVSSYRDVIPMVSDALENLNTKSESRLLLVKLHFVGATSIFGELNSNFEDLKEALFREGGNLLAGGAVIKIKNTSRPAIDLVGERERETILGYLLRALDEEAANSLASELKDEIENVFVQKVGQTQ